MTGELQEKITWQNINSSKERGKILDRKYNCNRSRKNERRKYNLCNCEF